MFHWIILATKRNYQLKKCGRDQYGRNLFLSTVGWASIWSLQYSYFLPKKIIYPGNTVPIFQHFQIAWSAQKEKFNIIKAH